MSFKNCLLSKEDFIKENLINPIMETQQELIKVKGISNMNENQITRLLVMFLINSSKNKFSRFHERGHIKIICQQEVIKNSRQLNQPDLEFCVPLIFSFSYEDIVMEAKRLNYDSDLQKYLGDNGFKRFSSRYYDYQYFFGMIAYVQKGAVRKYMKNIASKIRGKITSSWGNCFCIKHNWKRNSKSFHLFLDLS